MYPFFLKKKKCFPSLQDAAFAVEISCGPLAHEVPSPPSLPPAVDCSSEAQTMEKKYPDFPSLLDVPTSPSNGSWDPTPCIPKCSDKICCIRHCILLENTVCHLCLLCSQMIDSLFSFYWELFACCRVTRGDFDMVWQNTGDGSALGKLYLMGRHGWREWS